MIIRNMEPKDLDKVLSIADSAFFNEELYKWTVPNDIERTVFINAFFQFRLKDTFGKKTMQVAVDDLGEIAGAAIWEPPIQEDNDGEGIPPAFEEMLSKFGNDVREHCYQFITTVLKIENYFSQPYWALSPIFIRKKMQGKGIASLLIRNQLKKIDEKHLPCVLITQEKNNIPIYEKYGFKTDIKVPIGESGIISYGMIRQ